MRNLFICCFVLVITLQYNIAVGQTKPIFTEDFDQMSSDRLINGLTGKALDLTISAKNRQPIQYQLDKTKWKDSFTISTWVKADADFENYNILNLTVRYSDSTSINWKINKQANHTCAWEVVKADYALDYKPGPNRQQIVQDWNLLTSSYNADKQEIALYYNDLQVAIYSLEGLVPKLGAESVILQVGGEEKGDLGEWETFNGTIDDLIIFDYALSKNDIQNYYSKFRNKRNQTPTHQVDSLRVMTYNIWHGGNETGKSIGYKRIVEIIKESKADVVTMQETYGSGPRIADELGYYFYLRSSNISIMSRYPIEETLPSYKAFNNGNALIQVGDQKIVISSVWLNYPLDYWAEIDKGNKIDLENWKTLQEGNKKIMEGITFSLKPFIENANYPIIMGGDFNSGSHLDWVNSVKDLNAGYVMPFPTSLFLDNLGFKDTYRQVYKNPKKDRGITWTPINPNTHQDRIDYIFVKGNKLRTLDSKVIESHKVRYPSDHAAVVTTFKLLN